jgi:hypothetical protein
MLSRELNMDHHSNRYIELKDFIQNRMRIPHVYKQTFLKQFDTVCTSDSGQGLPNKNEFLVEYYHIVNTVRRLCYALRK